MPKPDLMPYARMGAAARMKEIEAEAAVILQAFPDLRNAKGTSAGLMASPRGRRNRKPLSAAARKVVSDRMKKYWASWRAAKIAKKR